MTMAGTLPTAATGHAVYTQNETGLKIIADCIMTGDSATPCMLMDRRGLIAKKLLDGEQLVYEGGRFWLAEKDFSGESGTAEFLYKVNMNRLYRSRK